MKVVALGPDEVFFRYHTPKWAHLPTSGAGAAVNGGRFNKPGVEALYLARNPQTALEEYKQDSSLPPQATLTAYQVNTVNVVDFSAGYDPALWPALWADWNCDWKYIARIEKRVPASWALAEIVISAGHAALLVPSTRHIGGTNLVLYPANFGSAGDMPKVYDPSGVLPSWPIPGAPSGTPSGLPNSAINMAEPLRTGPS